MSIIGAEDEDFENDLNEVSAENSGTWRTECYLIIISQISYSISFYTYLFLSVSVSGGPLQHFWQHRAFEESADPPAGFPATCHSAVWPCSPGENSHYARSTTANQLYETEITQASTEQLLLTDIFTKLMTIMMSNSKCRVSISPFKYDLIMKSKS